MKIRLGHNMKMFIAVVSRFSTMKYFYFILICQLLFVRSDRVRRNSYSSSDESDISDYDSDCSITKTDENSPLCNVEFEIVISDDDREYLHLKKTDRVLANKYLPIWIIKGKVDMKSIEKNRGKELKPQYGVMRQLGKFTMYHDLETSSSAVYFHQRRQFDGIINTRYLIQGLSLDEIDSVGKAKIQLGKSGIIPRLNSLEHPLETENSDDNLDIVEVEKNESEVVTTYENRLYDGYPEILIIVSFDLAKKLLNYPKKSHKYSPIVSYILTLFNGADMLYSKLKKTNIKLNIAGIIIESECDSMSFLKDCDDHQFNENNVHRINRLDASCTNKYIQKYLFSRADVIPFDSYDAVIFLTKKVLFEVRDDVEEILEGSSSVMSIYNNKKLKQLPISVATVHDDGNYGSFGTITHELAHLMSAEHDVKPSTEGKTDVEDKKCYLNIMKVTGTYWCKNCLSWSDESEEKLKKFFSSADCCSFINKPRSFYSPVPRVILTADEQCQCYGFKSASSKKINVNSYCVSSLQCQADNDDVHETVLPFDGTPCGVDKVCWGWICVATKDTKLSHCSR